MNLDDRSKLNDDANQLCELTVASAARLRVDVNRLETGVRLIDFGCHVRGGLEAGMELAKICMADRARVSIQAGDPSVWRGPWVQVITDNPIDACIASQYAGWPVQHEKYFAMGSGPMRAKRGKEHVLTHLGVADDSRSTVGVLECDLFPNEAVCDYVCAETNTDPNNLTLCFAPTRSIAGVIQVVARSVETSMHKLFELGFDLNAVVSGFGIAPMPPVARDFATGIGRTNDAILYGGQVTLWVETDDDQVESIGAKIPSCASSDFGAPFAEVFKRYNYDFYRVDPSLFSPAVVSIVNLKTGRSWRFGEMRSDVIASSFRASVG